MAIRKTCSRKKKSPQRVQYVDKQDSRGMGYRFGGDFNHGWDRLTVVERDLARSPEGARTEEHAAARSSGQFSTQKNIQCYHQLRRNLQDHFKTYWENHRPRGDVPDTERLGHFQDQARTQRYAESHFPPNATVVVRAAEELVERSARPQLHQNKTLKSEGWEDIIAHVWHNLE